MEPPEGRGWVADWGADRRFINGCSWRGAGLRGRIDGVAFAPGSAGTEEAEDAERAPPYSVVVHSTLDDISGRGRNV